MHLGGTGCAAAAIASGTSAQQDDDIVRIGVFTDDVASRSRTHNRANLHTLCNIIGMINFFYITGRKADLVAVGRVTGCCTAHQLFWESFPFKVSATGTVGSAAPVTRIA